jgi:carbamate kinase
MSRVVVALGGHALIPCDEPGTLEVKPHDLEAAADSLVALIDLGHEVVLTHGRGSQGDPIDPGTDAEIEDVGHRIVRALADRLVLAGRRTPIAIVHRRIVDATSIAALAEVGVIVVASDGPEDAQADVDIAAVELAVGIDADALLLLTDVPAACLAWDRPNPIPIRRITIEGATAGIENGTFPAGSMGSKLAAAVAFVRRTGRLAAIGSFDDAVAVLEERAGTVVVDGREMVDTSAALRHVAVA